jgi:phage shock protein C
MSTRTRRPVQTEEKDLLLSDPLSSDLLLEDVTDDDIEAFLEEQEGEKKAGFWNLPTIAGLSIITVGVAYLLQQMGISAIPDVGTLVTALPWFAGALIILLGFGVLSWSPSRKRKVRERRRAEARQAPSGKREKITVSRDDKEKRRLTKSATNKKLAGVCGGLGEYFGVDPTLIRIAFVIATLMGGVFPAIPLYIVLAIIMSSPEKKRPARDISRSGKEERVRVIRDSG